MDGVSCTLCHQIIPDNLGMDSSFTGQYLIDTATARSDRVIFGPYTYPPDSAHCGSCHTLYTPSLAADGSYLKEFPEQTTYLEWEHSGFEQTCQNCHLPDAVGSVVISNRPWRLAARRPFSQHYYVGGNSFMVNLLRTNAADLGVTADDPHLEAINSRTLIQLQENTATLAAEATCLDDVLTVTVNVTNLAGHKFPSGLPSRRAWLHVTVSDMCTASRRIDKSNLTRLCRTHSDKLCDPLGPVKRTISFYCFPM